MDYEKKYKEALERARKLQENSKGMILKKWLWNIFPELKESKDNRIMKVIRGWIYTRPASFFDNGISKEEILAWLEKQGEQNLIMAKMPQLGEQKSTDKIGPKFKIGDWVVSGQFVTQIREIVGDGYVNSHNGFIPFESAKNYHIWTIRDAKDGDVLASKDGKNILIFRNLDTDTSFSSYYNIAGRIEIGWSNGSFIPATKEQRDTLFAKMKEAGYAFNFEEKELKKLGQPEVTKTSDQEEIAEIPFGAKDSELQEAIYNIPKGFHAEIDNDKVVIKKGEKPTAWSDEDERNMQNIDSVLFYDKTLPEDTCVKLRNFLKSLKDRVQPKVELTQVDKIILEAAIAFVEHNNHFNCWRGVDKHTVLSALHSLRPQKQWKPSDEQMGVIEAVINNRSFQRRHLDSLYELLKKLKGE